MKKLLSIISVFVILSCTLCSCAKDDNSSEDNPLMLTVNTEELDKSIIQPVFDYFDGFNNNNAELVMSSFTPQSCMNQMKEDGTYEDEIATTNNNIDATHEMWTENHGANPKIEFKEEINNTTLSKEYLDFAKKYFEMTYYDLNTDFEIEEGYEYSFKYTVTGDDNSEEGNETACIVRIKDDGWKLIFCSSAILLSYMGMSDESSTESSENSEIATE